VRVLFRTASVQETAYFPSSVIIGYSVLRIFTALQRDVRAFIWLDVEQDTNRRIKLRVFSHLHSLSVSVCFAAPPSVPSSRACARVSFHACSRARAPKLPLLFLSLCHTHQHTVIMSFSLHERIIVLAMSKKNQ
jgi:hypothetical protein